LRSFLDFVRRLLDPNISIEHCNCCSSSSSFTRVNAQAICLVSVFKMSRTAASLTSVVDSSLSGHRSTISGIGLLCVSCLVKTLLKKLLEVCDALSPSSLITLPPPVFKLPTLLTWVFSLLSIITGSAVALHCVKAHRQSQWRSPNFNPL